MIRRLLKLAPTFLAIAVFSTLYWRIDILMLSKLSTLEQVGFYGACWRLLQFAMVVPTSLCLALYPQIVMAIEADSERLARLAAVALRYLLALTLPVAVAVTLLGEDLLALLFGASFRQAASTLTVLIWTLIPFCLVRYHAYVLVAANHQRADLGLNIIMSLLNIGLNLILIPRYGPTGAAIASLIAICLYAVLQYGYLLRRLPGKAARPAASRVALTAVLLTGAAILALAFIHPYLAMAASPLIYLLLLLFGGFFSRWELELVGLARLAGLLELNGIGRR